MKKLILLMGMISLSASAHLQKGEHAGTTAAGETCSMTAGEQTFENGVHHPLNERIQVQVAGDHFTVGHPAVVDAQESIASFNHDLFQGVLATATGAKALVIEMSHAENKEGPVSFTVITHNWKTGEATKVVCQGLAFKN